MKWPLPSVHRLQTDHNLRKDWKQTAAVARSASLISPPISGSPHKADHHQRSVNGRRLSAVGHLTPFNCYGRLLVWSQIMTSYNQLWNMCLHGQRGSRGFSCNVMPLVLLPSGWSKSYVPLITIVHIQRTWAIAYHVKVLYICITCDSYHHA